MKLKYQQKDLDYLSFNTLKEMYSEALQSNNEDYIKQLQLELMKRVAEEDRLLKRKSSIFGMREESTFDDNPLIN